MLEPARFLPPRSSTGSCAFLARARQAHGYRRAAASHAHLCLRGRRGEGHFDSGSRPDPHSFARFMQPVAEL